MRDCVCEKKQKHSGLKAATTANSVVTGACLFIAAGSANGSVPRVCVQFILVSSLTKGRSATGCVGAAELLQFVLLLSLRTVVGG